ncbi:MAG: molecular chaperone DnaJ [candidate division Zixibacteria bacterium]|jgi:molecular chaperone DnaJ|nr:molecular chaperone DnaJ [candidate division Zixibacteria bacterium]
MAKRDYYDVLGIDRGADEAAIKSAYRKKAMQYHPDRNPGNADAEEKFKEATEAYEILKDPQKRQMYDQYGHAGIGQGAGFGGGFGGFEHFDIGDALRAFMRDFGGGGSIFDEFFGGGGMRRRSNRGEDLRIRIALTLEEIASGIEKKIKVNRLVRCDTCSGSGVAAGSSRKTCPQCKGAGQVRTITRTFLGTVQQVSTCTMCRGSGEIVADPCKTCSGEGRVRGTSEVSINIPAGVSSGNYMTVDNMGNAAPNQGEPGDLIVVFEEKEHEKFTRHGDNVLYELAISFGQAALGAELEVPTINGYATLKIPPGTQSGKVLKLRGKGIPHLHQSGRGDQLVQLTVWVPTKLSAEDKKLLEKLESSEQFRPPEASKSFFDRLRETLGV